MRINNGSGNDVVKAEIINSNKEYDYAVIKLENYNYSFAELSTDSKIELGNEIVILGYPFGKKINDDIMQLNLSFTRGYISSIQTQNDIEKVFLDVSAKAGNSGSPVIDINTGKVIGILCGSILNQSSNLMEEINYMSPLKYLLDSLG